SSASWSSSVEARRGTRARRSNWFRSSFAEGEAAALRKRRDGVGRLFRTCDDVAWVAVFLLMKIEFVGVQELDVAVWPNTDIEVEVHIAELGAVQGRRCRHVAVPQCERTARLR